MNGWLLVAGTGVVFIFFYQLIRIAKCTQDSLIAPISARNLSRQVIFQNLLQDHNCIKAGSSAHRSLIIYTFE